MADEGYTDKEVARDLLEALDLLPPGMENHESKGIILGAIAHLGYAEIASDHYNDWQEKEKEQAKEDRIVLYRAVAEIGSYDFEGYGTCEKNAIQALRKVLISQSHYTGPWYEEYGGRDFRDHIRVFRMEDGTGQST